MEIKISQNIGKVVQFDFEILHTKIEISKGTLSASSIPLHLYIVY